MASLKHRGLIHPLLIRQGHVVVCGHRRLEAARRLGWSTIATRNVEELTPTELLALELDENGQRRDLTPFERSQRRVAEIQQARREAEERATSAGNPGEKSPRKHRGTGKRKSGRPKQSGSTRATEERTGYSDKEQAEAFAHFTFAERWPFLQSPKFSTDTVVTIEKRLAELPADEHVFVMTWAEADDWQPHNFTRGLSGLTQMTPARRQALYALAADDPGKATSVFFSGTMPTDPGLTLLVNGIERLKGARRDAQWEDAKDPLTRCLADLNQLRVRWEVQNDATRRALEEKLA
jgi:hypothetical protein